MLLNAKTGRKAFNLSKTNIVIFEQVVGNENIDFLK